MVNIVLVSHGRFCEGLLDSLQMVAGDTFGVKAVPLFPGETAEMYREKLSIVLKEQGEDGTLVLADIKGGTPYLSAAYLSKEFKIGLMTGMNMPMLVSAALERTEETTLEQLVVQVKEQGILGITEELFKKGAKKQRAKLSINKN